MYSSRDWSSVGQHQRWKLKHLRKVQMELREVANRFSKGNKEQGLGQMWLLFKIFNKEIDPQK